MQQKIQLRKKYLNLRKRKYFKVNSQIFEKLIIYIKDKLNKKKNINLALYYPSNFEFDILKVFYCERFRNFTTLLPATSNNNDMKFFRWELNDLLIVNKYGMLEPDIRNKKNFLPDIILIPLLAFDNSNSRLGYGKGYYDKYLSKYLKLNKNIVTIGIGFSFQKCKKLPTAKHDVRLNKVFTEKGFK